LASNQRPNREAFQWVIDPRCAVVDVLAPT
jgi:hypothetical protein